MATIQKFEDLICWQKARELTKQIYKAFNYCKDYGFRDQIQRASVPVLSNIAKGSAGEVRAQLYVALDIGYINIEIFKNLNGLAQECSKLIQSFAEKVKMNSRIGTQFKTVQAPDEAKEVFRQSNPELYKKLFG